MTYRIASSAAFFAFASFSIGLAGCALDRSEVGPSPEPGIDGSIDDAGLDGSTDAGDAQIAVDAGDAQIDVDGGPCGPCEAPFRCCDSACIDPTSDPLHCGGCNACVSGERSTATCVASTCGLVCEPGWADCDGDPANGCEANLTDVATCGACGVSCASGPSSTPMCTPTGCAIVCDAGRADCDGIATTGCEAALTSITSCGACGTVCTAPASASATCSGAGCGFMCDLGFADCDASATNGCESSLTSIASCGACGLVCPEPASASATCTGAGCGFTCDAGFDDCDGSATNGCEAELATNAMHCGACGVMCAPGRSCSAGACVGWTGLTAASGPSPRADHSAVWTGTEMIVWGGEAMAPLGDGFAYSPATNTWRAITNTGAPSARRGHTAVWTGTEMVIWGGYSGTGFLASGAAYAPATDTWRAISNTDAPSSRSRVPPIWTGSELVIWGGWSGTASEDRDTGARWNASANTWTDITTSGRPSARRWQSAVWTGSRMVIFSGENGGGTLRTDGFSYDPGANAWSAIASTDAPSGRARAAYVWTAGLAVPSMIVWGGDGGSDDGNPAASVRADGARYTPSTNTWAATSAAPLTGRSIATAVWTGSEMIVWGGDGPAGMLGDGAAYAPVANTWRTITTSGSPSARARHTAVWTGTEMIVFGGIDGVGNALGDGARLVP